jgi:nucleoside-diphosphate-sugar epimerase
MTVLVTGGTGFVGLNIAEALLGLGHAVVALDRGPAPAAAVARLSALGPGFACVEGDICDEALLNRLFATHAVSHVVQAAAITAGTAREAAAPAEIARVNLMGTIAVLEAARRHGVGRLVYTSSSTVYGANSYVDAELVEDVTLPVPDSLYGITKYAAERTALRYRVLHGMDIVAVRLSAVFGPWERDTGARDTLSPLLQATLAARAGRDAVLQRPGPRDWVYAPDVASAVATLLTAETPPAHALYNIGPGVVWRVADWCERLVERHPGFHWRLGESFNVDLHGPRDRSPLGISRIVADTPWRPAYGLDAAFEHYMNWLDEAEAVE